MKRSGVIVDLFLSAVAAVLGWQAFSSRNVPPGLPPMLELDESNFKQFEKSFDNSPQVLALLSPT
jgi:hypothetical protein